MSQQHSQAQQPDAPKVDVFSAILSTVASTDEQVHLISRDDKKFSVHPQVLKASSEFFMKALENGMLETGSCAARHLP